MQATAEDHASKAKGAIWLILALGIGVLLACGVAPLAHLVPWGWEDKLAAIVGTQGTECRGDAQAEAALDGLRERLHPAAEEFPVHLRIVRDEAVNAYAGLGGAITIDSGLLEKAESPDELAGVLAHEMEHLARRHIMEGAILHLFTNQGLEIVFGGDTSAAQWSVYFLNMNFTRKQEAQADRGALERLQRAQIDHRGFARFFARLAQEESALSFLSDHPASRDREQAARDFPDGPTKPVMSSEQWRQLKAFCGP